MLTLVSGGSASGKSEYAESLVTSCGASPRIYVATMRIWDGECAARVERHRAMRREKGFHTVEAPEALDRADIPEGSAVLLECMSNLAANECFGPQGMTGAEARILKGVDHLRRRASDVVVVTNELFSDGIPYDEATMAYLQVLARVNRTLAEWSDRVAEVVCGIPIWWKGGEA